MNSAEEISVYREPTSPYTLNKSTISSRIGGYSYDLPDLSAKKDKKWSIGSLFRRKKKGDSDGSSDEEAQKASKNFLRRNKRKDGKKKKPTTGGFDHVVMPQSRQSYLFSTINKEPEDPGILSDPTGGFSNYIGRALPKIPQENYQKNNTHVYENNGLPNFRITNTGSADSLMKKTRKHVKARAEARRTTLKNESSSDDESQRSGSSLKIRSEENLMRQRDSSLSRRSRAARTERYLKRHSRDGENPHNYLRLSRSDAEYSPLNWKQSDDSNRSPSRSPLFYGNGTKSSHTSLNSQVSNFSGLSTIPPPSHHQGRFTVSNSTSNPSYKPPLSMNDYNNSLRKPESHFLDRPDTFNNQRSVSCDANIHRAPSTELGEVMHVQFPIGRPRYRNLSLVDAAQIRNARQPPPPPPRDPSRLVTAHYLDNGAPRLNTRPNTCYFDNSSPAQLRSTSFNMHLNPRQHLPSFKSTSEDCLPNSIKNHKNQNGLHFNGQNTEHNVQMATRPASATPPNSNLKRSPRFVRKHENNGVTESFSYVTDKNPRSRKPILVEKRNPELSETKKALDFWKRIDQQKEENNSKDKPVTKNQPPKMFTCQTRVQTQVFLPSVLGTDNNDNEETKDVVDSCPVRPLDAEDKNSNVRKSSNLEDALNELEAIFNSLGLGDEDLLERAEQREKDAVAKKIMQSNLEPYPGYGLSRGALSDSSFSYEPFDKFDNVTKNRKYKKASTLDRKSDDMACRKYKDRASTISDPQSVVANVSYLLASPFSDSLEDNLHKKSKDTNRNSKEPDITFDDVVYKKIKHANNTLKVAEPQPPFGIPLGPITPAPNSDYLHAVPENIPGVPYKPRKIPDIVKDDLAFRNLRKDANKEPVLPPLSAEDLKNNNNRNETNIDLGLLKKRRAVRSLSANIGSLINKDVIEKARKRKQDRENENENEFNTLTDIADAMEIARQVLKEKENKIAATQKAFMSDTDAMAKPLSSRLTESRLNFINGLKLKNYDSNVCTKPPKSPVKERTPIRIENNNLSSSSSSSLDDLIHALSEEAKETTERINRDVKSLERHKVSSLKVDEIDMHKSKNKVDEKRIKDENLSRNLSEIDAVSEHAKLCEKLLECVVDSTELVSAAQSPTDEEVKSILDPCNNTGSVVTGNLIIPICPDKAADDSRKPIIDEELDYENLTSDKELNIDEMPVQIEEVEVPEDDMECKSPFEEHKAELIASFQELKNNLADIEIPKAEIKKKKRVSVNKINDEDDDVDKESKTESIYDNLDDVTSNEENKIKSKGEPFVVLENAATALPNANKNECAFVIYNNPKDNNNTKFTSTCDINLSSNSFPNNLCTSSYENTYDDSFNQMDSLESLKSPKLVLETAKLTRRNAENLDVIESNKNVDEEDTNNKPGPSREMSKFTGNNKPDKRNENDKENDKNNSRHIPFDRKSSPAWYHDPATMAVACSYGVACALQMASLDFVTILGIVFAILSFLSALLL